MFLVDWFYGILASLGLWQKEATILFLGLDDDRRQALLHMLRDERLVQHEPIGKIKFKFFDMGDHRITPMIWRHYHVRVDAVVYIVDANDIVRFRESKNELADLLSDESLANVPFLILGDNSWWHLAFGILGGGEGLGGYAGTEDELKHCLGLTDLTTGRGRVNLANNVRPLEVFMCNIEPEMGYLDGFNWLSQYIK